MAKSGSGQVDGFFRCSKSQSVYEREREREREREYKSKSKSISENLWERLCSKSKHECVSERR